MVVGLVTLSGIAVLNGLAMLTSIRQVVAEGRGRTAAARERELAGAAARRWSQVSGACRCRHAAFATVRPAGTRASPAHSLLARPREAPNRPCETCWLAPA